MEGRDKNILSPDRASLLGLQVGVNLEVYMGVKGGQSQSLYEI